MNSPESVRMVREKVAAAQAGMLGAQSAAFKASLAFTSAMMSGKPMLAAKRAARAPADITRAALAPAERKVRANARRLAKR